MSKHYSEEIASSIFRFLCKDEWHFGFHGEDGVFHFGLNLSNNLEEIKYLVHLHDTDYIVVCLCPKHADSDNKEMMDEMAYFLHRVNYILRNGNFELDVRDGEIRFRSYVDCGGLPAPTAEMVRTSLQVGAVMFERYGDAIYHIIEDGMTAKDAIVLCEGDEHLRSIDHEDDIIEIIEAGDDIPEDPVSEDDTIMPEFGAFEDDDDIEDLLRRLREMPRG